MWCCCLEYKQSDLKQITNDKNKINLKTLLTMGLTIVAVLIIDTSSVFAKSTADQVNRATKRDQLPKTEWGKPKKTITDTFSILKSKLPEPPQKAGTGTIRPKNIFPKKAAILKQKSQKASVQQIVTPKISITEQQNINKPAIQLTKDIPINIALSGFYKALKQTLEGKRTNPVTILHLGDEHIARDNLTGDLREMLQERFGNSGRGMTMPGPVFPFFRAKGVRISGSGQWKVSNSLSKSGGNYGLTGVTYSSSDPNAQVQFTSTNGPFSWAEVSFFTGPENGKAIVWAQGPGGSHQQIIETNTRQFGMRRVFFPSSATSISVFPEGGKPITLMSWRSGHNRPGVRYVNLGLPKATINLVQNLDAEFVQRDIQSINPSLIILSYGTNEGYDPITNVTTYEKKFQQLVQIFKSLAPKASLMIIGPPDVAYLPEFARSGVAATSKTCSALSKKEVQNYQKLIKSRGPQLARWHPPLKLAPVREAMRRVAAKAGVYYWDWSTVMGGPCGIHAWVHSKPKKATDNHRGLTQHGARESASKLFSTLMSGFDVYRRLASR